MRHLAGHFVRHRLPSSRMKAANKVEATQKVSQGLFESAAQIMNHTSGGGVKRSSYQDGMTITK